MESDFLDLKQMVRLVANAARSALLLVGPHVSDSANMTPNDCNAIITKAYMPEAAASRTVSASVLCAT